jgi:hypothetical protein
MDGRERWSISTIDLARSAPGVAQSRKRRRDDEIENHEGNEDAQVAAACGERDRKGCEV